MERSHLTITEYCSYHAGIEPDFVRALANGGLIVFSGAGPEPLIAYEQLPLLERYSRLHYDLDINLEGLEAIGHLLQRLDAMQEELRLLRSRLSFYRAGDSQPGAGE